MAQAKLEGKTSDPDTIGVNGESTTRCGVRGATSASSHPGVLGISENHTPQAGPGVLGQSDGTGVWGTSKTWMGVFGFSESTTGGAGVMGESKGAGVIGKSHTWHGVYGETPSTTGGAGVWGEHKGNGWGVVGKSGGGVGVWGVSETHEGMHAETKSPAMAAIAAYNLNPEATGAAIFGRKAGTKGHAAFFDGNVWVTGELAVAKDVVLANADCAEDFDIGETSVEPGTVMVLGEEGMLHQSREAYDKRVAGVISGAGSYKPAIVLDRRPSPSARQPVALLGKVYCKVDAGYAPIQVGDLLTTSPTPGHAMRVNDPAKALGAVLGKALRAVNGGPAVIPVLVALQ